jgi:hypothetical protein
MARPSLSEVKTCSVCKETKALPAFSTNQAAGQGRDHRCRECRRWDNRRRRYGVTLEKFTELMKAQYYCCAICTKPLPMRGRGVHIDHNHKTGAVRGLLCPQCNKQLGVLEKSAWVTAAHKYLREVNRKAVA